MAAVLLGAVALAVDVGQVYLVRRHLQNVTDQAALVGGQDLPNETLAKSAAVSNALANDATLTIGEGSSANWVEARVPPEKGPFAGKPKHLEVVAQKEVVTAFAGVLGQGKTIVTARAVVGITASQGDGALVSLKPGNNSMNLLGNADLLVEGGVLSNGDLNVQSSGGTVKIRGMVGVFDDIKKPNPPHDHKFVVENGEVYKPDTRLKDPIVEAGIEPPSIPSGACKDQPDADASGWITFTPGKYCKIDVGKHDTAKFVKGIYVVTGNVSIKGVAVGVPTADEDVEAWTALGNWDNPKPGHEWGPVAFYLPENHTFSISEGKTRFQAQPATYNEAKEVTDPGVWHNILIWAASGKTGAISSTGGDVRMIGTLYAPVGDVRLVGNSTLPMLEGQVIAWTITVAGDSGTAVKYVSSGAPVFTKARLVE